MEREADEAAFVAVDWGSTRLRLWRVDARGVPGRAHASDRGIGAVKTGEHRTVFLEALAALLDLGAESAAAASTAAADPADVYFAGMATSTLGWFQTPYLRVPVGLDDLRAGMRTERLEEPPSERFPRGLRLALHFLPGVRTERDVLRGEEVEVFGLLGGDAPGAPAADRVFVLPGTHSKWIRCAGDRDAGRGESHRIVESHRIADFVTVPTGDVLAALHRASVIGRTLPSSPVRVEGALLAAFDEGARAAFDQGPLSTLFKARALAVLDERRWPPESCSAYLSGALIAGELRERRHWTAGATLTIGGDPALAALYRRALGVAAPDLMAKLRDDVSAAAAPAVVHGLFRVRAPV
jgi:2-dehydro-3-deoxygalactonokinase